MLRPPCQPCLSRTLEHVPPRFILLSTRPAVPESFRRTSTDFNSVFGTLALRGRSMLRISHGSVLLMLLSYLSGFPLDFVAAQAAVPKC